MSVRCVRRGFTLVELLVVIAIIGILVALLLPAVQAAREAARRTECKNHLRQLGLATQMYHDTSGYFPPARYGSRQHPDGTDEYAVSWAFALLPYLEAQPQYDAWRSDEPAWSDLNATAMRTPLDAFYCPSRRSPAADRDFDSSDFGDDEAPSVAPGVAAGGDYAANAGTSTRHGMASFGSEEFDGSEFGPIFTRSRVPAQWVTDGLSKTLAMGEKYLPPEIPDADDGTEDYLRGDTALFAGNSRHTVIRRSSAGFPEGPQDTYRGKFGSEHSQLSHFAFLDGSVHTLPYDLEVEVFKSLSAVADGGDIPDGVFDD
ncbi:DUF1559 domain-containing protein [Botrimarina hoheduenensis]|uniref:Type II secretion system protein G n=1 Tax=Botrimarina hoheduenensis TaxID=2528000 RepID=A0A5C5W0M3_9BACT|nr:DUF1559 domain-containing protein [Botrimarina hoheduenensis]TWT43322.1 Type II secretion system protein G precursor [Botrimarina hoheduenensis]